MLFLNKTKFSISLILALAFLVIALGTLLGQPAAPSLADTVPTPVSVQNVGQPYLYATFFDASAQTSSTNGNGLQLPAYKTLDLQFVIDQTTPVNTATLTLQWSNDNSNWSDGPVIVNANAADADGMVQAANMGRYSRVISTLTGTNTVTITVKAVAH